MKGVVRPTPPVRQSWRAPRNFHLGLKQPLKRGRRHGLLPGSGRAETHGSESKAMWEGSVGQWSGLQVPEPDLVPSQDLPPDIGHRSPQQGFLVKVARWLSRLEHRPIHRKFSGSIPGQGTYMRRLTFLSLPPSEINKHILE